MVLPSSSFYNQNPAIFPCDCERKCSAGRSYPSQAAAPHWGHPLQFPQLYPYLALTLLCLSSVSNLGLPTYMVVYHQRHRYSNPTASQPWNGPPVTPKGYCAGALVAGWLVGRSVDRSVGHPCGLVSFGLLQSGPLAEGG